MKFDKSLNKFIEEGNMVNSGILIIKKSNNLTSILLLKRKEHKHWELPGGKVELKDKSNNSKYSILKNAALREVKEEINIDFKNKLLDFKPFCIDFKSPDGKKRRSYTFISLYNKLPKYFENNFIDCKYILINNLKKCKLAPNVIILDKLISKGFLDKYI
jgi:8-oxo-dGTP pyrophosphatase MutT (NUDIX family)